ncbi:MAG: hypothetical protein R8M45_05345, partial [Ghiorsea sp.]
MKVISLCLFRGFRVLLMLLVVAVLLLVSVCYWSPNIQFFETSFESQLKQEMNADAFDVSIFKLAWNAGPELELGKLSLSLPGFAISNTSASVSFPIFQLFQGDYAPEVTLHGGEILLDFDVQSDAPLVPPNMWFALQNVDI